MATGNVIPGRGPSTLAQRRAMKEQVEPELANLDECELLSGVSRFAWRNLCATGKVQYYKIGVGSRAQWYIPLTEVKRIITEGRSRRKEGEA